MWHLGKKFSSRVSLDVGFKEHSSPNPSFPYDHVMQFGDEVGIHLAE